MNRRKIILVGALFLLNFVSLAASEASAQANCQSEITYKWKSGDNQELSAIWGVVSEVGVEEVAVKEALEATIVREKKRASEQCRSLHENLAGCIASKFSATETKVQSMGYKARRALEDAIQADCKQQQGRCTEIVASEIKCTQKASPTPEGADAAKDKGKAKKK